ncbi:MAG: FAD-dependent oxidoreductase [Candidatus Kerfeldbacteria bacterium]|nr:FAD-dependent oxidoreductase [Candidatus Kerfeldbacteria bacterium]
MNTYHFPLKDRRDVAEGTTAFWFDTALSGFTFEAGQNIDLYLPGAPASGANQDTMHSFSLASSPHQTDHFIVATRMRSSAYKNTLRALPLGTALRVVGPNGNMVLHEDTNRPAVFLAGGIGITPFRSMVEWAGHQRLPHEILLFYSNRTLALTAFHDEFVEWSKTSPNFRYLPTLTDEQPAGWQFLTGKIDAAMLQKQVGDFTKPIFYLAGPPAMVGAMRQTLIDAGVKRDSVKLESFTGY